MRSRSRLLYVCVVLDEVGENGKQHRWYGMARSRMRLSPVLVRTRRLNDFFVWCFLFLVIFLFVFGCRSRASGKHRLKQIVCIYALTLSPSPNRKQWSDFILSFLAHSMQLQFILFVLVLVVLDRTASVLLLFFALAIQTLILLYISSFYIITEYGTWLW